MRLTALLASGVLLCPALAAASPGTPVPLGGVFAAAGSSTQVLTTGANFTATAATTVLTVTAVSSGVILIGQQVTGAGVGAGTTIISRGTGTGGTGTYNLSATTTVGVGEAMTSGADCPVGSTIVVSANANGSITPNSAADSGGNAYALGNLLTAGTDKGRFFYALSTLFDLPLGGTIPVTFSSTGGTKYVAADCVSGVNTRDVNGAGVTSTSTGTPGIDTGVLASPSEIIFGYFRPTNASSGDTVASGTGFTTSVSQLNSNTPQLLLSYQIVSGSTASVNYQPTISPSPRTWGENVISFYQSTGSCGRGLLLGVGC